MAETSTRLGRVSLVPRGAYEASAVYNRLDIVEHEGSSYLVLADGVTGVTPAAGPEYMLVAEKGDTGAVGPQGEQGEKGETGDTGPQGDKGEKGDRGEKGETGETGPQGDKGDPGADGTSFTVLGRYDTLDALQMAHPAGSEGDAWAVGSAEDNDIYLWNVDAQAWQNIGSLQGPPGPAGADGKSAYQYAHEGGYTGTEAEFGALLGLTGTIGAQLDEINGEVV